VSDPGGADARTDHYPPGTRVEVRSRFEDTWTTGFEVASVDDDGMYRLRRLSDGSVLPTRTGPDDVRRERKRETWWV
jgi:hypothetical protein